MRLDDISEGVAGPKNCWPGYRKVGTKPGTGRNAGKRVNDCEKIKESVDIEDTYKGWKFEVEFQKEDDRNVTFYSAISPEGKTHMLPKRATKEQFRQFVDSKTVKEGLGDEVHPADVGEYDREGDMAIGQLKTAEDAAAELRSILDSDENLPEWVQSKITKAVDYLDTARDYMKSKERDVAEAYDPWDEADMWYKFDSMSGTLRQRSWRHAQERDAITAGWSQSHEQALRKAGIIRSKYDPKKFVQKQGTKWVEVFPYGKP
jgi:hypothetical protein